jgi:hypothetical protein
MSTIRTIIDVQGHQSLRDSPVMELSHQNLQVSSVCTLVQIVVEYQAYLLEVTVHLHNFQNKQRRTKLTLTSEWNWHTTTQCSHCAWGEGGGENDDPVLLVCRILVGPGTWQGSRFCVSVPQSWFQISFSLGHRGWPTGTAPLCRLFSPLKWIQYVPKSQADLEKIGTAREILWCYGCTAPRLGERCDLCFSGNPMAY